MGRQATDPGEAFAEILAIEQLHRDIRRPLANAVVEDLNHVRTAELRCRLRFALEARLHLGKLRALAFDELDCTRYVQAQVRRVPHRAHAAATKKPVQTEALGNDNVGGGVKRHRERFFQRITLARGC